METFSRVLALVCLVSALVAGPIMGDYDRATFLAVLAAFNQIMVATA